MADYLNNFSLEGKVALITGASYGIGFAIAKAMAGAGATIVFNDIKQELVDKGLAAYEAEGIKAHGYVCDVTNEEAVNAFKSTSITCLNSAALISHIGIRLMIPALFTRISITPTSFSICATNAFTASSSVTSHT